MAIAVSREPRTRSGRSAGARRRAQAVRCATCVSAMRLSGVGPFRRLCLPLLVLAATAVAAIFCSRGPQALCPCTVAAAHRWSAESSAT